MKNLLKKISEINAKHWGLVLESNPTKYKDYHSAYMAEIETAIHKYTKSNCDCMPHETTGTMTEEVCNICGRAKK